MNRPWSIRLLLLLLLPFQALLVSPSHYYYDAVAAALSLRYRASNNRHQHQPPRSFDFDLVIVGAGAAGLFASGAASFFGKRMLLLEKSEHAHAGGDCTNAACVPSKALRSFASASHSSMRRTHASVAECQRYVYETVRKVRSREDPNDMEQRNPLLTYQQVHDCCFVDSHTLNLTFPNTNSNSTSTQAHVTSRQFLITTGAAPVIPDRLRQSADAAGVHWATYQSFLRPESNDPLWKLLDDAMNMNNRSGSGTPFRLLVAGGGATACELAQSLGRLTMTNTNKRIQIVLVAPALLPQEDVKLQQAAHRILQRAGRVEWIAGRVADFGADKSVRIVLPPHRHHGNVNETTAATTVVPPVDAALLCLGRSPAAALRSLRLERAGVTWSDGAGVHVHPHSLRSVSARHVFAAGDCCSAVTGRFRSAGQAAWTGYHAVRNLCLPAALLAGDKKASVHPNIPRVVYTE